MTQFFKQHTELFQEKYKNRAHLLISCPDKPGIVSTISKFLFDQGANIIDSDQYTTDPTAGMFFMRIDFECEQLNEKKEQIKAEFQKIADEFSMDYQIEFPSDIKKMAIFVSKEEHCLLELLWEWQSGGLMADIALVVSNHPDLRSIVESYGIDFHHIPVTKDTKAQAEQEQAALIEKYDVDFIVLARYMQILTPDFVAKYPNRIINIHHSFLPAFIGARPYERAYDRGVKIIGATSHYVTNDLDEGPIIEQDVERVNHKDNVNELKRIGRHIERQVFARAVKWHIQDRIIVHSNKTIVFK